MRKQTDERGDTIVEVLIAIAIIGAVLIGAFGVVTATARNALNVKEHAEALKLLESQVEGVRKNNMRIAGPDNDIYDYTKSFCYKDDGTRHPLALDVPNLPDITTASFPAECLGGEADLFRFGVSRVGSNTFKARVVWDSANGGETREEVVYKVYP